MKMTFKYRCEGTIGIVELTGSKHFDDAMKTWKTIRLNIEKDRLSAVLLIDHSISSLRPSQVIEIQQWMASEKFPKKLKIAIVDEKMANEKNNNNVFGETVVYNRGWANFKVFNNEASARKWLGLTD
ncbi:MAG: hypothetical protein HGB19_02050 [Chlorobiales bacterium]|jgi:hypothetical protein|nr:hypothetical protein [Chlorobiales bacterium]